jgi:hypothetical protein
LANISVFFDKNSEPADGNVKKRCSTGISGISRQFNIREKQGARFPVNSEQAPERRPQKLGARTMIGERHNALGTSDGWPNPAF